MTSTAVCERVLGIHGTQEGVVVVQLFAPTYSSEHEQWLCGFRIEGIRDAGIELSGVGYDGLAAVISALVLIEDILRTSKLQLYWEGAKHGTGFRHFFDAGSSTDQDCFEQEMLDLVRAIAHEE